MEEAENKRKHIAISVMITFYNQKKYIEECLSSVMKQETNFDFEVLCGDDGSVDGTYEELLEWQKRYPQRIKIYQMERDSNKEYEPIVRASNNRYNLLLNAKGKYITFLDGDDYYLDIMKLQKQYDVLEHNCNISCCCHSIKSIWENPSHADEIWGLLSDKTIEYSDKVYWKWLWFPAESFLFRNIERDKIEKINKNFFDDNIITAHFCGNSRIIILPDPMVVYRQRQDSSWNKRDILRKIHVNILLYQELKKILPKLKVQCFIKCRNDIRLLYDNRNEDWNINNDDKFAITEPIYVDTANYRTASSLRKMHYIIKWFLPSHCNVFLDTLREVELRLLKRTIG